MSEPMLAFQKFTTTSARVITWRTRRVLAALTHQETRLISTAQGETAPQRKGAAVSKQSKQLHHLHHPSHADRHWQMSNDIYLHKYIHLYIYLSAYDLI